MYRMDFPPGGMSTTLALVVLISFACDEAVGTDSSLVHTSVGSLRGRLRYVLYGKSVRQFLGIPFAEPPVGELRFARPQPVKPWTGVLRDATEYGRICPQIDVYRTLRPLFFKDQHDYEPTTDATPRQSEDCLTLNVFTLGNVTSESKLAVMVWFHGGGLVFDSARSYDPSVLVALNDVIVVTVNYRLGVLGFFNVPGTDVKGNYGMHDQILALQWVQTNIKAFGGNPESVTIFGESAGGMSVSMHLLSPLSKGLFHRVIAQSGSSLCSFCCFTVKSTDTANRFANALGCELGDGLLSCLRNKTTDEVFEVAQDFQFPKSHINQDISSAVIDGEFLVDAPETLLRQGKVNRVEVIIGFNREEGGMNAFTAPDQSSYGTSREIFEWSVRNGVQNVRGQNMGVTEAILFEYTDHADPENKFTIRRNLIDYSGDGFGQAPAVKELNLLAQAGVPAYFYVFKHHPTLSFLPEWVGAYHGVELHYLFGAPLKPEVQTDSFKLFVKEFTDLEIGFSMYVMRLWSNFAKTGDPNSEGHMPVTWPRYTNPEHAHLNIEMQPSVGYKYRADKMAFWNEFLPKLLLKMQDNASDNDRTLKDEL